jgi:hypothetical protein
LFIQIAISGLTVITVEAFFFITPLRASVGCGTILPNGKSAR